VAQQGNLVLLGARVYHAELKRWIEPDTVDLRRYTYAGGDPVNFVDPGGRMPIEGGGGGTGGGGAGARSVQSGTSGGQMGILQVASQGPQPCSFKMDPTQVCVDESGKEIVAWRWMLKNRDKAGPGDLSMFMDEQVVVTGFQGHLFDMPDIRYWRPGMPIPGTGGPMDPFEVPGGGGGAATSQPPWGGQAINVGWKQLGAVSFSFTRDPFNQFYFSLNVGVGLSLTGVNVSVSELIPVTHQNMAPVDFRALYRGVSGGFSAFAGPGAATSVSGSGLVQQIGVGTPQVSVGGSYTWCVRGCR
jgi:hypothetical protein